MVQSLFDAVKKKKEDILGAIYQKTAIIQGSSRSVGQFLTNLDYGRGCSDMIEDKHEVVSMKKLVETLNQPQTDCP